MNELAFSADGIYWIAFLFLAVFLFAASACIADNAPKIVSVLCKIARNAK